MTKLRVGYVAEVATRYFSASEQLAGLRPRSIEGRVAVGSCRLHSGRWTRHHLIGSSWGYSCHSCLRVGRQIIRQTRHSCIPRCSRSAMSSIVHRCVIDLLRPFEKPETGRSSHDA